MGPVAPVAPVAPVKPVGPVNPVGPVGPLYAHWVILIFTAGVSGYGEVAAVLNNVTVPDDPAFINIHNPIVSLALILYIVAFTATISILLEFCCPYNLY